MRVYKAAPAHEDIAWLGEGPVWNERDGRLYYLDIFRGRIWRHDPAAGRTELLWQSPRQIGGMCFDMAGDPVLFMRGEVSALRRGGDGELFLERLFSVPMSAEENFNDVTADPEGRVYAGTLDRAPGAKGRLWLFEKGRPPQIMLHGIGCSNGMGFSPDRRHFYHTDTAAGRISRYERDDASGGLKPAGTVYAADGDGLPDGMTVDRDGNIWTALWGGGAALLISPGGDRLASVAIPARQASSVALGGGDMRTLFITSACQDADDLAAGTKNGVFLGGPLYCVRVDRPGAFPLRSRFL